DVHLIADDMNLAQQVTTGSSTAGVVNLEPFTASEPIHLGSNTAGTLGLTNSELNEVTAKVLRIGSSSFTGDIIVTVAISPANVGALSLVTTGASSFVGQLPGATITVAGGAGGLTFQTSVGVGLVEQNDVGTLAAAITATTGFEYTDANGFTIGTV